MFYIGIEDIAALALIQALEQNERFLSYEVIEAYGNKVVRRLRDDNEKVVLILSRESTNEMFRNYSDFFEEKSSEDGKLGIALREEKNIDDLIDKFCGYLSLTVLKAFMSEKVDLNKAA